MSRTYSRRWCYVCGRDISSAGLAWYNHCMKHVREGKMTKHAFKDINYHTSIDFQIVKGTQIISPKPYTVYRATKKQSDDALKRKKNTFLHEESQ